MLTPAQWRKQGNGGLASLHAGAQLWVPTLSFVGVTFFLFNEALVSYVVECANLESTAA